MPTPGRTEKIHRAAALLICAFVLAGCSSTKQTTTETPDNFEQKLREAEASFRPSDHDPLPANARKTQANVADTTATNIQTDNANQASGETVQGFRVQAYSSTNIDQAQAKKAELESLYPEEWFYLDYASPSYRIRAGNFLSKYEADRFARAMNDQGFKDAWAVPERVYKNPGKRPAPPPPPTTQEPEIK
jgi:hypothetical protein